MTATALPSAPRRGPAAYLGLALGATGVVYGDIGTSPLYAFKESIAHLRGLGDAVAVSDVIGVVSLMFSALIVIVTLKYMLILSRFDNRGEGGVLSLMALVQRAGGRGAGAVIVIGMLGAGLFFGDAVLTPAISVLSAVEGLSVIHGLEGRLDPYIVPITLAVLVGLFAVQSRGTSRVGAWFGPVCVVWFLVIGTLGLLAVLRTPQILAALNPLAGVELLVRHPALAAAVMGSVFLTVTGAEALYADLGHFGKSPIGAAWIWLVFPCLVLNYLGQGALVMENPQAAASPFFLLAPDWFQLPLVLLATAATVIASQAVISGAYSLTQQAIQLGLLPRLELRPTSEHHAGQIYAPQVNWMLLAGVVGLVLAFRSSSNLAAAYGVSVVGTMITSSILAVVAIHRLNGRPTWLATLFFSPFLLVEGAFALANLTKVTHGGYVPLFIAALLILVMGAWVRGSAMLRRIESRDPRLEDVLPMLGSDRVMRAKGTAVFLSSDPYAAPAALMHNLKHNQVLHDQVVILTVRTAGRPRTEEAERVEIRSLAPGVHGVVLTFGYMETPDVVRALRLAKALGLFFDIARTSFFLSRRVIVPRGARGWSRLLDSLFAFLARNAVRASDFFRIPPSRVLEIGAQVSF